MSKRKRRGSGRKRKSSTKKQGNAEKRGWLKPKAALTAIGIVCLFAAGNVFYSFYKTGYDLGTTLIYTFFALITPAIAAGVTYYIREKITG